MIEQDKPAFRDMMMAAGEVYGKEITKPLLQMYFSILGDMTMQQVSAAMTAHMRDEKVGQYFPKPADMMRNASELIALKVPEERSSSAFSCEVSMSAVEMRAKVKSGDYAMGSAYMAALELEVAIAEGRGVKINRRSW